MTTNAANNDELNHGATREMPWAWHPNLPIENAPVFSWPLRPLVAIKYVVSRIILEPLYLIIFLFSVFTWLWLVRSIESWQIFSADWILQIFVINLSLVVFVAGGLHLYFYTFKTQHGDRQFDTTGINQKTHKFFANNQCLDNIFWTCASGVPIWSAYQVILMWSYATPGLRWIEWSGNPVWFVILLVAIPLWQSFHFYWIHRFLHWKPLYKLAHSVHHRNINIGPWTGISMHPIEHALYFSSVFIHLVVPSHPIHIFFHMYFSALGAIAGHSGFESIRIWGKSILRTGDFFHQLHHRYFDCNYGTADIPLDKWFDSFHDGTPERTITIRQHQMQLRGITAGNRQSPY